MPSFAYSFILRANGAGPITSPTYSYTNVSLQEKTPLL